MNTQDKVIEGVAQIIGKPAVSLDPHADLTEFITDSLDLVEVAITLQERFNVRLMQEDLRKIRTLAELSEIVATRVES